MCPLIRIRLRIWLAPTGRCHTSPGHRPGCRCWRKIKALKGRPILPRRTVHEPPLEGCVPMGLPTQGGAALCPCMFLFQIPGVATACRPPACGDEPSPPRFQTALPMGRPFRAEYCYGYPTQGGASLCPGLVCRRPVGAKPFLSRVCPTGYPHNCFSGFPPAPPGGLETTSRHLSAMIGTNPSRTRRVSRNCISYKCQLVPVGGFD